MSATAPAPLSPFRAGGIFVRLRWRRLLQSLQSRNARIGPALICAILVVMTGAFFGSFAQILNVLEEAFAAPGALTEAVSLLLLLSVVAALCTNLGLAEVVRPEWDLEWLATLPLPRSVLLLSRVLERALVSPALFLGLFPMLTLLWARAGLSWWRAPLAGYATALPLFLVAALIQTLIDTGIRVRASGNGAASLRNLQAGATLVGCVAALLVYFQATGVSPAFAALRTALGHATLYLPTGTLARLLVAGAPAPAGLALLTYAGQCALIFGVGFWLLLRQLRQGVAGTAMSSASRAMRPAAGDAGVARPGSLPGFLSPLARRELRLLARDRNYLAQAVIVPALVAAMNLFWRPGAGAGSLAFAGAGLNAGAFSAVAFFVISYSLMFSSFRMLGAEGPALWILYTVPVTLKAALARKARFWMVVAAVYAAAAAGYSLHAYGGHPADLLWRSMLIVLGIPIFSALAMALGILAFDGAPTGSSTSLSQSVRPSFLYLYVTLLAVYAIGIYGGFGWQSFVSSLLMALVAYAFWQKAMDQLPYLLEPVERPPARISLADGLLATQLFFVLQALAAFAQARYLLVSPVSEGLLLFRSYAFAGAGTCLAMLISCRRRGMLGELPGFRSARPLREAALGILQGAVVVVVAVTFLAWAQAHGYFAHELRAVPTEGEKSAWYTLIAVTLAPVFEELIFRGLVFPGLRRGLGTGLAILGSALLFAVVHPPVAFVPVLCLGAANAWLYGRTGSLVGPVAAHAFYNFCLSVLIPLLGR